MQFPRRDPVPIAGDQPHSHHPFVQTQGRVFHYGPGLQRELASGMPVAALPTVVLGLEFHLGATAGRANDAIGPTAGDDVVPAVLRIGENLRSLLKGLGFGCHT